MSEDPRGPRTKPSNRLTHGLTSRARAEEWFDDVSRMADELVADAPRTPEIMDAARALAHEIILLQAIRVERIKLLTTPPPPRDYEEFKRDPDFPDIKLDILTSGYPHELPKSHWGRWSAAGAQCEDEVVAYVPTAENAGNMFRWRRRELRTLDEYERKAMSRRRKLLHMMDYFIVEAVSGRKTLKD